MSTSLLSVSMAEDECSAKRTRDCAISRGCSPVEPFGFGSFKGPLDEIERVSKRHMGPARSPSATHVPNLSLGLPPVDTAASPVGFSTFKLAQPCLDSPSDHEETPKPALVLPLQPHAAPDAPVAEPSFSTTPYATEQPAPWPLAVHTQHAPSDTSLSPFDVCETPKARAGFGAPPPLLQPPRAPLPLRSSFDPLNSAHTSASPSPRLDPAGLFARPLAADFPDSAAEGSVGGGAAEDASPFGEQLEPSLCNSFHAAEELAGDLALMQDIPSASQGTSQGSLADNKVLRTTSQYSNHSGDRGASGAAGEAQPGSRGLSAAFTYTACLGDTRTATVYRASNASGEYAVKEIKRVFATKRERAELLQEVTVAAALPPHRHLVRYHRGWQEGRKLHIQMELCGAGSADTLLKRGDLCGDEGALPEGMLWLLLHDAAAALEVTHRHGVLHMDVKPENLFLAATGHFKLGDFGLAVRAAACGRWEEGDGRFVAPELLSRAAPPSAAADVYSLGASVLHCATGKGVDLTEMEASRARELLAHAGYGAVLQRTVCAMLARTPADRPSAADVCAELALQPAASAITSARAVLVERAAAIAEQRRREQQALHCSPSFSLSQSIDMGTPRRSICTPRHAAPAADPLGPVAAAPHDKPWDALLRRAASGVRAAKPGRGGRARDAAPAKPPPPLRVPAAIGTPPSVEPKLHQTATAGVERSLSMGSLRKGALSFSSQAPERSDSIAKDGDTSEFSFAPDAAVDAPAAAPPARQPSLRPPQLPMPPLRCARLARQPSAATARSTPRSTPRSGLENCIHGGAPRSSLDVCSSAARPQTGCTPRAPVMAATAAADSAQQQQDVLDRYWSSQRDETPPPRAAPADSIPREPIAQPQSSPVEGCGSVAEPAPSGAAARPPAIFLPQATPVSGPPQPPTLTFNPCSAQSAVAGQAPKHVAFMAMPAAHGGAAMLRPRGRAGKRSGRPPAVFGTEATMPQHGGLGVPALSRQRSRADAERVRPKSPPQAPVAEGGVMLRQRSPHSHFLRRGAQKLPRELSDRDRERANAADARAMPAPPARRSRGARIAGVAIAQENAQPPTLPLVLTGRKSAPRVASVGSGGKAAVALASHPINLHAAASAVRPGRSGGVALAAAARMPLQPRDAHGFASGSRPELSNALPMCRVYSAAASSTGR